MVNKIIVVVALALCSFNATAQSTTKPETVAALKLLEKWKTKNDKPVVDSEGRLLYAFGSSMPQVVCAPLNLCDIKLQPGEKISSVRLGDKIRWLVNSGRSGEGRTASEHLIIKPTSGQLNTSLFVGTDRRVYIIELISHETQFMAKVGFLYNDDGIDAVMDTGNSDIELLAPLPIQSQVTQAPVAQPVKAMVTTSEPEKTKGLEEHNALANNLYFGYKIKGPNVSWKPIRVYDDGVKTYIDMNKRLVSSNELPVFLNNDTDQRGFMINYRYVPHDGRYIIDGLFDKGSLVLGDGKKRKKVKIIRDSATEG